MQKNIIIDETEIFYTIEGVGEVVILLHGWPQTSYMWRKIIPNLSKNFKVITLDLPGLGNSSDTKTYDTKNIATILNKFIKNLQIEKFHLVHISEYSDRNAGVQPDTFAMRFSRV
ncbi:alpha/beta fold hydrolase [Aliarcobacter butzleri]|uniref:alpha/beta fold hydrolase n=1 Tax=Aliarcobacter butzleri TaxID=28197 RepID=UPI001EDC890E|nr:alpha/beta fold hydrolase [Aliarcobacter butzleri]MCG3676541.1 alpha/beta hydrolase [Aliarcobacter butzleri]